MTSLTLPENAALAGPPNLKTFAFRPDYTQSGSYIFTIIASDGELADTAIIDVTVTETGNHAPFIEENILFLTMVVANRDTTIVLNATDVDGDPITMTCDSVAENAVFTDSGNGIATYYFAPSTSQIGEAFRVNFIATDPSAAVDTVYTVFRVITILRGDVNSDEDLNLLDIMYLISYLYKDGQAPASSEAADANFDNTLNLMDCTYLINFFYKSGPPPPTGE